MRPTPEGVRHETLKGTRVMPAHDPSERRLSAQIAAHASWANTEDRAARTAAARKALDDRFLREAGGDPIRAEHLRKAHYARLSLKAQRARRKAREARTEATDTQAEIDALGGGETA